MAKMQMPAKEDLGGGGNWLNEAGIYHLLVVELDEQPTTKEGKPIDGIKAISTVLGGPNTGKKFDLILRNPNFNGKDKGKWAMAKLANFAIATGLATEEQCGEEVDIDWQKAKGRQYVAVLEMGEPNEQGKSFVDLAWANVYHVDDPRAAKATFSKPDLDALPANMRRTGTKPPAAAGTAPPASKPSALSKI